MDLPQLRAALERVASAKWAARVAKPAVVQKMLRHWVLPFASVNRARLPRPVDALFTPKTLALLRGLEHGLKVTPTDAHPGVSLRRDHESQQTNQAGVRLSQAVHLDRGTVAFGVCPVGRAEGFAVFARTDSRSPARQHCHVAPLLRLTDASGCCPSPSPGKLWVLCQLAGAGPEGFVLAGDRHEC